ncbi:MAG: O-antigen ligase family protein [Pseudonocardiaceae bacterium]
MAQVASDGLGLRSPTTAATETLRPGWPLALYFGGYLILWAAGVAQLAAPLLAVPMVAWLLMSGRIRLPRGFGLYLLFLGWMLASALIPLAKGWSLLGFAYHATMYITGAVFLVYAYNLPGGRDTTRRIADLLALLWIVVALCGLFGPVLPSEGFPSLVERVLPRSLLTDDYIQELVHPRFAEVSSFLGYPVPRPAAPFPYTNTWGASLALLSPFFVVRWLGSQSPLRRHWGKVLMLAAIVPVVVSLNRGMWLSLGLSLLYTLERMARRGGIRRLQGALVLVIVVGLAVWLSPLSALVGERIRTGHSNEGRLSQYEEVIDRIGGSPLLGYGSPRPTETAGRDVPLVGSLGQFWLVLFSHGIPAAVLFTGWIATMFWRTRSGGEPIQFSGHVTLLIAGIQLPYYVMLPTELMIVMVAAALALRGDEMNEAEAHSWQPSPKGGCRGTDETGESQRAIQ